MTFELQDSSAGFSLVIELVVARQKKIHSEIFGDIYLQFQLRVWWKGRAMQAQSGTSALSQTFWFYLLNIHSFLIPLLPFYYKESIFPTA